MGRCTPSPATAHRMCAASTPRATAPRTITEGYNCNVFRCYDGKGNTWQRP